jgi:hypothetical protein
MGTIRPRAAWLTQYYAATHWSQANYVALVSGQFTKCEQQDFAARCHQNVENLFHQPDLAHLTWKTWLRAEVLSAIPGREEPALRKQPAR